MSPASGVAAAALLFVAFSPATVAHGGTDTIRQCNPQNISDSCGRNAVCVQNDHNDSMGRCVCNPNYEYIESRQDCVLIDEVDASKNHSAITIIVILILLALIICSLVLAIRRYNLIHWLQQKLPRRDTTIMYEDVMIGQDDPPIAA